MSASNPNPPNIPPPGKRAVWELYVIRKWVDENELAASEDSPDDMAAFFRRMDDMRRACRRATVTSVTNFSDEDVRAEMDEVWNNLQNSPQSEFLRYLHDGDNNDEPVQQLTEQSLYRKSVPSQSQLLDANTTDIGIGFSGASTPPIEYKPLPLPVKQVKFERASDGDDNEYSNDTLPRGGSGPFRRWRYGYYPPPKKTTERTGKTVKTLKKLEELYGDGPWPKGASANSRSGRSKNKKVKKIKMEPVDIEKETVKIKTEPTEPAFEPETDVNYRKRPARSTKTRAKKFKAEAYASAAVEEPKPKSTKQTSFPCGFPGCPKVYTCKNGLKYHRKNHHLTPEEETARKAIQANPQHHCPILVCPKAYQNRSGLKYHMVKHPELAKMSVEEVEQMCQEKEAYLQGVMGVRAVEAQAQENVALELQLETPTTGAADATNEGQWEGEVRLEDLAAMPHCQSF